MSDHSKAIVRIVWCSPHPTHYGVYLLDQIGLIEGITIEAVYFYKTLVKYPWKSSFSSSFKEQYLRKVAGIDWTFFFQHLKAKHELPVIAGWNEPTMLLLALVWSATGKPFLLFSDTPEIRERKGIKQWVRRKVLQYIFKRVYRFLVTGQPGIDHAVQLGIAPSKVVNFPFATNTDFFIPKEKEKPQHEGVVFISSGRLDNAHKAYDVALKAFGLLKKRKPELRFRYVIAGEGSDRKKIEQEIKEENLEGHVELKGWIEPHELLAFYQEGDVLVHSSNFDPFPNAVLEAMACGLPVIGSDAAGSVLDRIADGANGYIHHQQDVESLYQSILKFVMLSSEARLEMGRAARATAVKWNVAYHQNVIQQIVKKYRASAGYE